MWRSGRVVPLGGGFRDRLAADRAVADLAATQLGIVTGAQLLALGLTPKMIETRVRRGSLHRVYRGVYAVGHVPITREARWLAAVYACGKGAVLSHRSAAALWGARETQRAAIDVTAPSRRGYTLNGIDLHRATTLEQIDMTTHRGVPVTSLARTIIDLATVVSSGAVEYAIHRAEAQRRLTVDDLRDILERLPGKRGTAVVGSIVGAPGHELSARTRSRLELRLLEICREHALPEPRVNVWIPIDNPAGGLEVDFLWPEPGLVVEVDEQASHSTLRARRNDPARDQALRRAGLRVVRVAEDEFDRPGAVAAKLRRELAPDSHLHPVRSN